MALNVSRVATLMKTGTMARVLASFRHKLVPVTSQQKRFASTNELPQPDVLQVTFVKHSGEKLTANCKVGQSLLDIVANNELDIPGYGACEGTLTCSTCHVILSQEDYDRIPDKPMDDENDMLDLAYELTDTSRLGCQIAMTKDLNGLEVKIPKTVNDARN